jgi:hypothetical protein
MPKQEIDFISPFALEECLARVSLHHLIERDQDHDFYIIHGVEASGRGFQPDFKLSLKQIANGTHIKGVVYHLSVKGMIAIAACIIGVGIVLRAPVLALVLIALMGFCIPFLTSRQNRKFMPMVLNTFQPVKKRKVTRFPFRHFALPFIRFHYPVNLSFDACTGRIQGLVFTHSAVQVWEVDDETREFVIVSPRGSKIMGVIERDNATSYVKYGFGFSPDFYLIVGFMFLVGGIAFSRPFNIGGGLLTALGVALFAGMVALIDTYFFHRRMRQFLNSPLQKIEWYEAKSKRKVG